MTAHIGDLVWIEDDNDGDATTGNITFPVGATVTATASSGTIYTDIVDVSGSYSIEVPILDTYTVTAGTPAGTTPTLLTGGDTITDTSSGNNLSHDGSGTVVTVGVVDNPTLDFGFYQAPPAPSIALEKMLNTPEPVLPGASITFTIRITNTGTTTITTLPLTDTYNTTYLTYVGLRTTPASDSNANNGQIVWSDLTQANPNGFGQDFGPNDVWDVVVEFVAALDTTPLPDSASINTAQAMTHTVTDTVQIFNPTNVMLVNREVVLEDGVVVLSWSTVNETDLVGFHVMRLDEAGDEIGDGAGG
ncbi:MAG: hypothetical protein AAF639_47760, partial [Chloroflexota bacterium]